MANLPGKSKQFWDPNNTARVLTSHTDSQSSFMHSSLFSSSNYHLCFLFFSVLDIFPSDAFRTRGVQGIFVSPVSFLKIPSLSSHLQTFPSVQTPYPPKNLRPLFSLRSDRCPLRLESPNSFGNSTATRPVLSLSAIPCNAHSLGSLCFQSFQFLRCTLAFFLFTLVFWLFSLRICRKKLGKIITIFPIKERVVLGKFSGWLSVTCRSGCPQKVHKILKTKKKILKRSKHI